MSATITDLVDLYLGTERELLPHSRPKSFRASSMGYCARRQVLERGGVERTEGFDAKTLRIFSAGDAFHWWLRLMIERAGLLVAEEVNLYDEEWGVSGHVDGIWGGPIQPIFPETLENAKPRWTRFLEHLRNEIEGRWGGRLPVTGIEIKSANGRSMKRTFDQGHASESHAAQIATYYLLANRNPDQMPAMPERWDVVMLGKEFLGILEWPLRDEDIAATEAKIELLRHSWSNREVPPCTCTEEFNGKGPLYCAYKEPGGTCCSDVLVEAVDWVSTEQTEQMEVKS